ncbi:MAG: helicase-related protein, partial [Nitrobacter sp.]
LVEALGVLDRQKVGEEVKNLDQPARATLRKYGVRFGAYHIYLPGLMKPAPRALATQLHALKHESADAHGVTDLLHLAAAGRTSSPVDQDTPTALYRTSGYRICGDRAVRVDILERLADLIRPALAWREGSPGEKPAGAFDGRGFVVTQAMTSLAGSAGEDFAAILRALGYRMDRRPAPPPAPSVAPETNVAEAATPVEANVSEPVSQDTTVPDATPQEQTTASSDAVEAPVAEVAAPIIDAPASDASSPAVSEEPVPSAALLPDVAFAPASEPAEPAATVSAPVESTDAAQDIPAPADATGTSEDASADAIAVAAEPTAAAAAAAEPAMVEVWRPGGRSDERRPRHDRHRHRRQEAKQDGAQPVVAEGETAEGAEKRERHGRGRRDRHKNFRRPDAPSGDAATKADGAPERGPREDKGRPPRERFHGKGRDRDQDKGRFQGSRKGGGERRPDGGPSLRPYASSAPRERERPLDPNSPFAKLAALKEQLAGRKD